MTTERVAGAPPVAHVGSTFVKQIVRNPAIIPEHWGAPQLAQLFFEIYNICLVSISHKDLSRSESFFASDLKTDFELITLYVQHFSHFDEN